MKIAPSTTVTNQVYKGRKGSNLHRRRVKCLQSKAAPFGIYQPHAYISNIITSTNSRAALPSERSLRIQKTEPSE
jgi:hypothetical protein